MTMLKNSISRTACLERDRCRRPMCVAYKQQAWESYYKIFQHLPLFEDENWNLLPLFLDIWFLNVIVFLHNLSYNLLIPIFIFTPCFIFGVLCDENRKKSWWWKNDRKELIEAHRCLLDIKTIFSVIHNL